MKPVLAPACFALAFVATAAAAELKPPHSVATEWNKTIQEAYAPFPLKFGLKQETERPIVTFKEDVAPKLRSDRIKTPNPQMPELNIDTMPKGDKPHPSAREWNYNGRRYWIIPITA